jgi:hypothetical protein
MDGLAPSNSAGRSAAEEASSHPTEKVTDGHVLSVVPEAQEIEISEGLEISATVVVGGSLTVAKGTGVPNKTTNQRRTIADDIMSYAYPKYSNHPDAAAHVKQFRSICAVNHGTQGLSSTEREQSMIVEFQLSLEGQAARWYAQQLELFGTFGTFQELVDKFLELFQVKIDPTEVLKEYYSLQQQAAESVANFLLRFGAVQAMLDTQPAEDIQKRQFLKALREPLS